MENEIEKGFRFQSPSKETLERLAKGEERFKHLDESMNNLNTDVKLMKQKQDIICEKLEKMEEKLDKFIIGWEENAEKKFASKIVERILLWAGAIIGAGIIGAILKTILK